MAWRGLAPFSDPLLSRLQELGTEAAVKAAGKHRQEGKNYVMADGDIVNFKFNVTAEKKK